jgi:hypothetical protein
MTIHLFDVYKRQATCSRRATGRFTVCSDRTTCGNCRRSRLLAEVAAGRWTHYPYYARAV